MANPFLRFSDSEFLLNCAANGDVIGLQKEYMRDRSILTAQNAQGMTAMHLAACHGHVRIITFVLECGLDQNIVDSKGRTALHIAAQQCYPNALKLLLNDGADCRSIRTSPFACPGVRPRLVIS
jgi:ankyrin repeat protein